DELRRVVAVPAAPPEDPPLGTGAHAAARVLLVDGREGERRALCELLAAAGCEVAEARDGVAALMEVGRTRPDVVVLDLEVRGLDGYVVLSRLRSHRATSAIPVIVLTARDDEDSEVRVFELGADDVLARPVRVRALTARVAAALRRCRASR
ncbi:MAG: response regulator transcription factor, partial [Acidimicrobiales bacterium]